MNIFCKHNAQFRVADNKDWNNNNNNTEPNIELIYYHNKMC